MFFSDLPSFPHCGTASEINFQKVLGSPWIQPIGFSCLFRWSALWFTVFAIYAINCSPHRSRLSFSSPRFASLIDDVRVCSLHSCVDQEILRVTLSVPRRSGDKRHRFLLVRKGPHIMLLSVLQIDFWRHLILFIVWLNMLSSPNDPMIGFKRTIDIRSKIKIKFFTDLE